MNISDLLQNAPKWLSAAGVLFLAIYTLLTALATFFLTLSKVWPSVPFFASATKTLGTVALGVHTIDEWLSAFSAKGASAPKAPNGYARVGAMAALAAILLCACGILSPKVVTPVADLEVCISTVASGEPPGTPFAQVVTDSGMKCLPQEEQVVEKIIEVVLSSQKASLAPYKDEATSTKADPSKRAALSAHVAAARRGAGQ